MVVPGSIDEVIHELIIYQVDDCKLNYFQIAYQLFKINKIMLIRFHKISI